MELAHLIKERAGTDSLKGRFRTKLTVKSFIVTSASKIDA